jgi:aryl-alcohol dehydrogenase-like predicted oxidoreductase
MLAKSPAVVVIPGVRRVESAVDSAKASDLEVTTAEVAAIEAAFG